VALEVRRRGFRDVRALAGGWQAWLELGVPVHTPVVAVSGTAPTGS
jgi:3-mercaptopyruvate sulfurtransferase SseA